LRYVYVAACDPTPLLNDGHVRKFIPVRFRNVVVRESRDLGCLYESAVDNVVGNANDGRGINTAAQLSDHRAI
jgi:hypothetical protein